MTIQWDIDDAVDDIAASRIVRFYPTYVAKLTGLPLSDVFERLLKLAKDGKLQLRWEIRCPRDGCARTVEIVDCMPSLSDIVMECACGEDIDVTGELVFPVFEVCRDYKERLVQQAGQGGKKKHPMANLLQM